MSDSSRSNQKPWSKPSTEQRANTFQSREHVNSSVQSKQSKSDEAKSQSCSVNVAHTELNHSTTPQTAVPTASLEQTKLSVWGSKPLTSNLNAGTPGNTHSTSVSSQSTPTPAPTNVWASRQPVITSPPVTALSTAGNPSEWSEFAKSAFASTSTSVAGQSARHIPIAFAVDKSTSISLTNAIVQTKALAAAQLQGTSQPPLVIYERTHPELRVYSSLTQCLGMYAALFRWTRIYSSNVLDFLHLTPLDVYSEALSIIDTYCDILKDSFESLTEPNQPNVDREPTHISPSRALYNYLIEVRPLIATRDVSPSIVFLTLDRISSDTSVESNSLSSSISNTPLTSSAVSPVTSVASVTSVTNAKSIREASQALSTRGYHHLCLSFALEASRRHNLIPCGLGNNANTCYLNATLQTLTVVPELRLLFFCLWNVDPKECEKYSTLSEYLAFTKRYLAPSGPEFDFPLHALPPTTTVRRYVKPEMSNESTESVVGGVDSKISPAQTSAPISTSSISSISPLSSLATRPKASFFPDMSSAVKRLDGVIGGQQDAAEMVSTLLNALHDDLVAIQTQEPWRYASLEAEIATTTALLSPTSLRALGAIVSTDGSTVDFELQPLSPTFASSAVSSSSSISAPGNQHQTPFPTMIDPTLPPTGPVVRLTPEYLCIFDSFVSSGGPASQEDVWEAVNSSKFVAQSVCASLNFLPPTPISALFGARLRNMITKVAPRQKTLEEVRYEPVWQVALPVTSPSTSSTSSSNASSSTRSPYALPYKAVAGGSAVSAGSISGFGASASHSLSLGGAFETSMAPQKVRDDDKGVWTMRSALDEDYLPPVLSLTLSRFSFSMTLGESVKNTANVEYPTVMRITSKFLQGKESFSMAQVQTQANASPQFSLREREVEYELSGVVVHQGDRTTSGHYTSYSKQSNWFYLNDTSAQQVRESAVQNSGAYILLYTKKTFTTIPKSARMRLTPQSFIKYVDVVEEEVAPKPALVATDMPSSQTSAKTSETVENVRKMAENSRSGDKFRSSGPRDKDRPRDDRPRDDRDRRMGDGRGYDKTDNREDRNQRQRRDHVDVDRGQRNPRAKQNQGNKMEQTQTQKSTNEPSATAVLHTTSPSLLPPPAGVWGAKKQSTSQSISSTSVTSTVVSSKPDVQSLKPPVSVTSVSASTRTDNEVSSKKKEKR